MNFLDSSIAMVWEYPALISVLQIVTNMQESCSFKSQPEGIFGIRSHKASEPIIGNTKRWNQLPLAAVLETSLAKDRQLSDDSSRSCINVWGWEDFAVMQENLKDIADCSFVDSYLVLFVCYLFDIVNVVQSMWVER